MKRHSIHIKIDGELTPGATRLTGEFSRSAQATARGPHRWATKSRTRPSLISSCRSWSRRKKVAKARASNHGR